MKAEPPPAPPPSGVLLHEVGKGTTPAEIWPSHHRHEERGLAMLAALRQRIALPEAVADLAALVIADADRVHRASEYRAGPLAALLTRWEIDRRPQRFEALLQVCSCDYAAYEGHRKKTTRRPHCCAAPATPGSRWTPAGWTPRPH